MYYYADRNLGGHCPAPSICKQLTIQERSCIRKCFFCVGKSPYDMIQISSYPPTFHWSKLGRLCFWSPALAGNRWFRREHEIKKLASFGPTHWCESADLCHSARQKKKKKDILGSSQKLGWLPGSSAQIRTIEVYAGHNKIRSIWARLSPIAEIDYSQNRLAKTMVL